MKKKVKKFSLSRKQLSGVKVLFLIIAGMLFGCKTEPLVVENEPAPSPSPFPSKLLLSQGQLMAPSVAVITTNTNGMIAFEFQAVLTLPNQPNGKPVTNYFIVFTNEKGADRAQFLTTNFNSPLTAQRLAVKGAMRFNSLEEGEYGWRVVSSNQSTTTNETREYSGIFSYRLPVRAVSGLVARGLEEGGRKLIELSWNAPGVGGGVLGRGYEVYFGINNPPPKTNVAVAGNQIKLGAAAGRLYYYRVATTNGLSGAAGRAVSAVRSINVPAKPEVVRELAVMSPAAGSFEGTNEAGAVEFTLQQTLTLSAQQTNYLSFYTNGGLAFKTNTRGPLAGVKKTVKKAVAFSKVKEGKIGWRVESSNTGLAAAAVSVINGAFEYRLPVRAVSGLVARGLEEGGKELIELSWNAPGVGEGVLGRGYEVYFGINNPPPKTNVAVAGNKIKLGAAAGRLYYYQVATTNGLSGAAGRAVSAVGQLKAPKAPVAAALCGTVVNGFTIVCSYQQLKNINNNLIGRYRLGANINLAGSNFSAALIAPDTVPGGTFNGNTFEGVFDGGGYTIKNMSITNTNANYLGLFGKIGSGSVDVTNLRLEQITIKGKDLVGAVVGQFIDARLGGGFGLLQHVFLEGGSISGRYYVGGLIGQCWDCRVKESAVQAKVSGESVVGGLVGAVQNSFNAIENSYSAGVVKGKGTVINPLPAQLQTLGGAASGVGGLLGAVSGGAGPASPSRGQLVLKHSYSAAAVVRQSGTSGSFNPLVGHFYSFRDPWTGRVDSAALTVNNFGNGPSQSYYALSNTLDWNGATAGSGTAPAGWSDKLQPITAGGGLPAAPAIGYVTPTDLATLDGVKLKFQGFNFTTTWTWEGAGRMPILRRVP